MDLALQTPWVLALLPLALLPLLLSAQRAQSYPSIEGIEADPLSVALDWMLRIVGSIAIVALILGIGGLHRLGRTIEKSGEGAHIVLLIDRSSSMDNTFAGRAPEGGEESKSAAARRLLKDFIVHRDHDLVGVAAFSTSPMHVLPMTEHKDAVLAAVDAMDRPGLAFTNVGRGLALALDMQEADPSPAARVIVLVSDGAAVIDRKVQEKLRAAFARRPINLYWLFLRTAGTPGISTVPAPGEEDTPQAMPERHLDKFFKSLGIDYRAFEAENPEAIALAIAEIGKLERSPITYLERIPHEDLKSRAFAVAAAALLVLLAAKLAEVRLVPSSEDA
ncbi:MAG: VWA domain-containing protein [Hyphomicrobium zavarzinii]|jgi:mxaC protein|uniref:vWA domain-containing protein n=1 Tax=Hyphomicrobium TaxID=81 RepID=UPI000370314D|nr:MULTISPECIES: vWA domain-containing protein [Hyphomicrobium]MBL8845489.1 VWA domain-containing protein [Hyphomicrobium zavarzinii]WBT37190.1 VWA domain-containing protein [Hyphomicrobium sp. DMF-1]HML41470.1 vWA domain-containing protein [Hyphomicrobium zavarzinii]